MSDSSHDPDRAAILARRQRFIALALSSVASGCASRAVGAEEGSSSTSVTATSSSTESSGSEDELGTEGELDTSTESGLPFVPMPEACLSPNCDTWNQDCPTGEKCVPYGSTGENWDATKCVIVEGDGAPGDPCTYGGTSEATDNCDEESYCWDVELVEDTLTGVCRAFCQGTPDNWMCDEGQTCLIANNGDVTLCIAACDPLLQDCAPGQGCSWTGSDFACVFTSPGPELGEPCGFINDCPPSTMCLGADATPNCMGSACCVEFCDVTAPDPCPDPQLECLAYYTELEAPVGLEDVGVCVAVGVCQGGGECDPPVNVTE